MIGVGAEGKEGLEAIVVELGGLGMWWCAAGVLPVVRLLDEDKR